MPELPNEGQGTRADDHPVAQSADAGSSVGVDTFTCGMCHETFEKAWTDEEAQSEMEGYFGKLPPDACVTVCDDCYEKIHPAKHPDRVFKAREHASKLVRQRNARLN